MDGILARADASLRFEQQGKGADILLLHAGGERRQVWRPVMEALAPTYRCTAYDQRGHGESGGSRDGSVTDFGEDTVAMISRLRRPVVVGASLGGFAALLALADPEVERASGGLVLVDIVPDPDPERTRRFLGPIGMADGPLVADILGRAQRLREIAAGLSLPILAIRAGERTGMVDEDAERFSRLVPHAEIVTVPGAGHLIAREKPLDLAAHLSAFAASQAVQARLRTAP